MKRLSILVICSLFLFIGFTVKAQTPNNDQLGDPGVMPGDFFYFFDRFFEDVSLWLTFSDDGKVEKYSSFAEERLAELNGIDPDKNQDKIDELFDDYGISLTKANELLTDIIIKEKIKEAKIIQLQERLADVTTKHELVNSKTMNKVSVEAKNKVNEIKVHTYLTTMSNRLSEEEKTQLQDSNIRGKDRLKIKALADLAGLSVEEVLNLDIYYPDDPTTSVIEKDFDYTKLESVLGLTRDELIDNLKEYNEALKDQREAEKEEHNADEEHGKSQEEIDEIKEEANQKQEEAKNKKDEIEDKIKDNIKENKDKENGNRDDKETHGNGNNQEPEGNEQTNNGNSHGKGVE